MSAPMTRALCVVLAVAGLAAARQLGDTVTYVRHDGHFEKNTSELKGDSSYLVIASREEFDKVFGAGFTMGKKPNVVPADAFEKNLVLAVIKRGPAVTTYSQIGIFEAGPVDVRFKSETGPAGTARFASPLVLTIPKAGVKEVRFLENGKLAAKVAVR